MTLIFGTIAVLSALMVITDKNTIHSVFYLVMSFVNSSIILLIWGVDYLGLLLIIVYVGAIAILFLFVVMMINIKNEDINRSKYVPIGLIVALVLMLEVYIQYPKMLEVSRGGLASLPGCMSYEINGDITNVSWLGNILYSWDIVIYASLVLFVAMIGAIVLTLSHSEGVKRQDLYSKWTH